MSRTRKVVNYSEDQSRSPPRNAPTKIPNDDLNTQSYAANDLLPAIHPAEVEDNLCNPVDQQQLTQTPLYHDEQYQAGDSPSKNALACGPPIKLRISKVSTFLNYIPFLICY